MGSLGGSRSNEVYREHLLAYFLFTALSGDDRCCISADKGKERSDSLTPLRLPVPSIRPIRETIQRCLIPRKDGANCHRLP
jgi:hypothetical protein